MELIRINRKGVTDKGRNFFRDGVNLSFFNFFFRQPEKWSFPKHHIPDKCDGTGTSFFLFSRKLGRLSGTLLWTRKLIWLSWSQDRWRGYVPSLKDYDMDGNLINLNMDAKKSLTVSSQPRRWTKWGAPIKFRIALRGKRRCDTNLGIHNQYNFHQIIALQRDAWK